MGDPIKYPWEVAPPPQPSGAKDSLAAGIRGAAVNVVPSLIRLGSGLGAFEGGALGAGISGGGETIAQMIENGTIDPSKLNKKRIALEAGLGAIPAARLVKEGKALASAALGGTAAAVGVAGRKLTADNPEERKIHPANDLFNIALGAGVGGLMGHLTTPKEVKVPDNWDIQTTAVPGGRVLSNEKGKLAEVNTLPSIAKEPPSAPLTPPIAPTEPQGPVPIAGQPPAPYRASAKAADKAVEQGWQQEGRNLNARDKYLKGVATATDIEALQIEKQRMADWAQEAKNLNARDQYIEAAKRAGAVDERLRQLREAGATPTTVVTQTAKKETPEGTQTATTVTKVPPPSKDTGGGLPVGGGKGKAPTGPIAPKPGIFQIVQKNGKIIETSDEATAEALVNAGGPGTTVVPHPTEKVVPPPVIEAAAPAAAEPVVPPVVPKKAAAKTPKAAKSKVLKGTATQVAAALEGKTPPPEPPAAAALVPTPTPPPTPPPVAGAAVAPPVAPSEGGLRLSAPLATKVAEAQQGIPAGSVIARLFKNRGAALKAGAYNEQLPEGTIGGLTPLLGQAEAGTALGGAGKSLWNLVKQVSNELELPKLAGGKDVKPTFRLAKTPSGEPFVPSVPEVAPPAAPVGGLPPKTPAGLPVGPGKPVSVMEQGMPEFPPIETGRPLKPELKARIKTAQDQMQILQNSGRGDSAEADKLAADIEGLQRESFAQQYPELAAEQAQAEQAPVSGKKPRAPRKPRGGTTLGAGLGGAQGIMDIIRENPAFAARLGLTSGGAAIGAATDQDNPVQGAVLGGAAGYGAARGLEHIGGSTKPLINWDPAAPGDSAARALSGFQRFNFLSDPLGLAINTVAAPFGAGMMGSLERALVGRAEGSPEKVQQGLAGVRELLKSYGSEASTRVPTAWNTAKGLIGRAEDIPHQEEPSKLAELFSYPGKVMTTGDALSRDALLRANIPDEVARGITVTSNPRYDLGNQIVNFAKKPVTQLLLPFSRTSANILEGSLERTPIIGFLMQKTNDPNVKATMAEVLTRQGLGGATWYAAYELGKHADPNVSKDYKLNTLVSNMAGQYGLLAAAGFAAGQAQQMGKVGGVGDLAAESAKQYVFGTPLPSTRPMEDVVQAAKQWPQGQPIHPGAQGWLRQHLPAPITPGIATAAEDLIRKKQVSYPWENQ